MQESHTTITEEEKGAKTMETRNMSIVMKTEHVIELLKKGRVTVFETVSPTLSKKATFVKPMLYIHDEGEFFIPKYKPTDIVAIRESYQVVCSVFNFSIYNLIRLPDVHNICRLVFWYE